MDALDRYLKAMKPFLPRTEREEILREVRATLIAQMSSRQDEIGRPLDDAEREALLDRNGQPMEVARRYWRGGAKLSLGVELIGPQLFAIYWRVLLIPVAITMVIFSVLALYHGPAAFRGALMPLGIQLVTVTAIFIGLQAGQRRQNVVDRWKPNSLPANEMLRRYLHALRFWLPASQQEDIVAEVGEDMRSRIEDRESELGRNLTDMEVAAILRQRGQPMVVASSYLPQKSVVSPPLYAAYIFVLKLVVLWILVPCYLIVVGPMAAHSSQNAVLAWGATLWGLAMGSVFAVGAVTLVFAALERFPKKVYEWDPQRLPPVPATSGDTSKAIPRYLAAAELVMSVLIAAGWVYIMRYHAVLNLGEVRIVPAPIWQTLVWPIFIMLLGGAAAGSASLFWPYRPRLRSAIRLGFAVLTLVIVIILLNVPTWVQVTTLGSPGKGVDDLVKGVNLGIWISLIAMLIVVGVDVFQEARRMLRKRLPGLPAVGGLAA